MSEISQMAVDSVRRRTWAEAPEHRAVIVERLGSCAVMWVRPDVWKISRQVCIEAENGHKHREVA